MLPLIPYAIECSKETAMCNKLSLHHSNDALWTKDGIDDDFNSRIESYR